MAQPGDGRSAASQRADPRLRPAERTNHEKGPETSPEPFRFKKCNYRLKPTTDHHQ